MMVDAFSCSDLRTSVFVHCSWIIFPCLCCRCLERSEWFRCSIIHVIDMNCRYNIEPFFFSSSLNWIPSHYQEEVRRSKGDREYL
jgi:hypothetical protein